MWSFWENICSIVSLVSDFSLRLWRPNRDLFTLWSLGAGCFCGTAISRGSLQSFPCLLWFNLHYKSCFCIPVAVCMLHLKSLTLFFLIQNAEKAWTEQRAIFIQPTNKCTRLTSPTYPFTEFIVHVAVQKDFYSVCLL